MIQKLPPLPLLISFFITLFLIVFSFTITAIASPYIVGDLGGDRTITTYAISFFGFGAAISIPSAKPLAARFGGEKVFIGSLLFFALTNFLCASAPTYFVFIAFRFLMGIASGFFYPLLAHFFSTLIPSEKRIFIVWTFVTILVVVPVVGACFGGTVAYLYNWRACFYPVGCAALVLSVLVKLFFKKIDLVKVESSFDWMGWIFYALGIFCITFVCTCAQELDWYRSDLLITAFFIGMVFFGYYLVRSFSYDANVMELKFFAKPLFSLAILSLAILFAIYFGIIILLAIWLVLDVQFTPTWIAVLLGIMGIAGFFPRLIIKEKAGGLDPRIWIMIATAILAISCFYTTLFDVEINFGRIAISRILAGFGLALFLPPIFQMLSCCFAPGRWVDVFVVFQSVRNLASGLGASIFSVLWQRRTVFYHERLNEKLNLQSNAVQTFFKKAEALNVPGNHEALLNNFLDRRSSSLALDDVFYLMGWILVGLFVTLALSFIFKREEFDVSKSQYK